MILRPLSTLIILLFASAAWAQIVPSVGLDVSGGDQQGSASFYYSHLWLTGSRKKLEIGPGLRFSAFFADYPYYTSAPPSFSSSANNDSLLVNSPRIYSLNLMFALAYRFSGKIAAGFNIDVIGITLGNNRPSIYVHNGQPTNTLAGPSTFNLLLIDNNDKGTLNSQFFIRYQFDEVWAIKFGAQHLFTEYTTNTDVQQFPSSNDRFRLKSTMVNVGVEWKL